jgi:RNA polymerase sigma factor (sigma-70 family)
MANGQAGVVLRYLRQFVGRGAAEGALDRQLLTRFAASRDEAAFTALVQRHGGMVLGVCRRVLANAADADDAFQATFLVLVRKAASIRQPELLANWLYGVAFRTARTARAAAGRRASREKELLDMPDEERLEDQTRRELRWSLDEELVRLPDKYRLPIVLCYLEGRTKEEAAQALGWPHGTVSVRLARARELLRGRLSRRGLALPSTFLAACLFEESAAAAVSHALAAATVQSAILYASSQAALAGAIAPPVAALTKGVLKAMFMTKLKFAATVVVALGIVTMGASVATYSALAQGQSPGKGSGDAAGGGAQAKPGKVPVNQDSIVELGVEPKQDKVPTVQTGKELRKLLTQPTDRFTGGIEPGTSLKDALTFIGDAHGVQFRIDYAAFIRQGVDKNAFTGAAVELQAVKGAPLGAVIRDLLSSVSFDGGQSTPTYLVKGNQIVVVPLNAINGAENGGEALREAVQVAVDEKALGEALRELADATGANIVLDVRLKEKAKTPVTASLQHVPLETAVRLLADMAEVKAVSLDNVIYVTTKENAEKWLKEQRERELGIDPAMMPAVPGGLGGVAPAGGTSLPTPKTDGTKQ